MPAINITSETVVDVVTSDDGVVSSVPLDDLLPKIGAVLTISALLVLIVLAVVIYKSVTTCHGQYPEYTDERPKPTAELLVDSVSEESENNCRYHADNESAIRRWCYEDNPHNKWNSNAWRKDHVFIYVLYPATIYTKPVNKLAAIPG